SRSIRKLPSTDPPFRAGAGTSEPAPASRLFSSTAIRQDSTPRYVLPPASKQSIFPSWRIAVEINSLRELYIDQLRDLYDAENQLIKALPKMAKGATSDQLREG